MPSYHPFRFTDRLGSVHQVGREVHLSWAKFILLCVGYGGHFANSSCLLKIRSNTMAHASLCGNLIHMASRSIVSLLCLTQPRLPITPLPPHATYALMIVQLVKNCCTYHDPLLILSYHPNWPLLHQLMCAQQSLLRTPPRLPFPTWLEVNLDVCTRNSPHSLPL